MVLMRRLKTLSHQLTRAGSRRRQRREARLAIKLPSTSTVSKLLYTLQLVLIQKYAENIHIRKVCVLHKWVRLRKKLLKQQFLVCVCVIKRELSVNIEKGVAIGKRLHTDFPLQHMSESCLENLAALFAWNRLLRVVLMAMKSARFYSGSWYRHWFLKLQGFE
jgi:hypothetical protein